MMRRHGFRVMLLGVLVLAPVTALANGPQRILKPPPDQATEVTLMPLLNDRPGINPADLLGVRVTFEQVPQNAPGCAPAAYFMYAHSAPAGHRVVIPVELVVQAEETWAAGDDGSAARVVDPYTGAGLVFRLRESDEGKLTEFASGLPADKQTRLREGVGRESAEPLTVLVTTSEQPPRCLRLDLAPAPARNRVPKK
jgi:hypothetical protein